MASRNEFHLTVKPLNERSTDGTGNLDKTIEKAGIDKALQAIAKRANAKGKPLSAELLARMLQELGNLDA
jgi:hypothetical protein